MKKRVVICPTLKPKKRKFLIAQAKQDSKPEVFKAKQIKEKICSLSRCR